MVPKFRAWDKAINEMIPWRMLLNVYNLRNVFIRPETCGLVLMQSTGLKDKNGVEIFDGDLVKKFSNINKFTDDFAEDIEPIYVITSIVRDGACFKTTFKGVPSFVLDQNSMSMVEHMEVVGNIYENPELLETANES